MVTKFLQWAWKPIPIKGKIFTVVICGLVIIVLIKQIPTYDTLGFRIFRVLLAALMIVVVGIIMIKLSEHADRKYHGPISHAKSHEEAEQESKSSYIPRNVIRPVSRRWWKKGGDDA